MGYEFNSLQAQKTSTPYIKHFSEMVYGIIGFLSRPGAIIHPRMFKMVKQ